MSSIFTKDDERRKIARTIGIQILKCRTKAGLTQHQLAMEADITQSAVWEYEAGKKLAEVVTLLRIAKVLNVKIEELVPISLGELSG